MIFMLFLILSVLGCVAWMLTVISDQLRGLLTELEKQRETIERARIDARSHLNPLK